MRWNRRIVRGQRMPGGATAGEVILRATRGVVLLFISRLKRVRVQCSTRIDHCGSSLLSYPHPGMSSTTNVDNHAVVSRPSHAEKALTSYAQSGPSFSRRFLMR